MTVYVDILVIINTLVNYFMLLGVKTITRADTKRIRLVLGALWGGVTSLTVFWKLKAAVMFIKIVIAVLMIFISFPVISPKVFMKKCIWLFIISAVFSGVCLAVYLIFDTDLMIYSNGTVYFDVDITFLTVCTVISYIVISLISRFTDKKSPSDTFYDITLISGDLSLTLRGFMDTGNNLKEPFSFAPVIITNEKTYKKLYLSGGKQRERIIPVKTSGGDGIIHAFRLDGAIIDNKIIHNIYIGCGSIPNGCDVLLCPDLLGENYEKIKANN